MIHQSLTSLQVYGFESTISALINHKADIRNAMTSPRDLLYTVACCPSTVLSALINKYDFQLTDIQYAHQRCTNELMTIYSNIDDNKYLEFREKNIRYKNILERNDLIFMQTTSKKNIAQPHKESSDVDVSQAHVETIEQKSAPSTTAACSPQPIVHIPSSKKKNKQSPFQFIL